jgi:hypothetical protein
MLQLNQQAQYLGYITSYKSGTKFPFGSNEYNNIINLEIISPTQTKNLRERQGVFIPSLTFVERPQKPGSGGEIFFDVTTQPTNIGLPPGTTPTTKTTTTSETTPGTTDNFLSKYKFPLIIGAVAIGYFLLKRKK